MADILLPAPGSDNWGDGLNAAVAAVNDDVETAVSLAGSAQAQVASLAGAVADGPVQSVAGSTGVVTADAILTATGALTAPLGDVRYAPVGRQVYGPRWVFDGDSITKGSQSAWSTDTRVQDRVGQWASNFTRLADGRVRYLFNAAVGGQVSADALARFDANVAPWHPDVVFLTIGTNDSGQGVAEATWLANISAYYDKCLAIGARLVLGEIFPTNAASPAGRGATVRAWNIDLHVWADAHDVDVVPWTQVADPTTGGFPATWTSDQIHPGLVDSNYQLGLFAYNFLASKLGPAVIYRPSANAGDLLPNGFFTTLSTALAVVTSLATAPATGTGTLAAGTYSYKVTATTYYGESVATSAVSGVLGATGQIVLTWAVRSGARGYRVFRKAPGDADWFVVSTIESGATVTVTDNGSLTPGTDVAPAFDSSQIPTNLTVGALTRHKIGSASWLFTEAGTRGNILRFRPYITGTTATSDYMSASSVVAGASYLFTAKLRGSTSVFDPTTAFAKVIVRFAGGSGFSAPLYQDALNDSNFRLVSLRWTAPTGVTDIRLSFELGYQANYIDVAEAGLVQVPAIDS